MLIFVYKELLFGICGADEVFRGVFFFKETIVYHFVQYVQIIEGINIFNNEKCDINNFLEVSGMFSL